MGFVFALAGVFIKDYEAVMSDGFFQGYNSIVICVITLQVGSKRKRGVDR